MFLGFHYAHDGRASRSLPDDFGSFVRVQFHLIQFIAV